MESSSPFYNNMNSMTWDAQGQGLPYGMLGTTPDATGMDGKSLAYHGRVGSSLPAPMSAGMPNITPSSLQMESPVHPAADVARDGPPSVHEPLGEQSQVLWPPPNAGNQAGVAPNMNPPMINVSLAGGPRDQGSMGGMEPWAVNPVGSTYSPSPSQSMSGSPSNLTPLMTNVPYGPSGATGHAGMSQATSEARRTSQAHLKGLLKLDVNMGFSGDLKLESPTSMLQPVVGWKKRRSASDVGPRTPSLLGPSVDMLPSPVDDLAYLVQSMSGGRSIPTKELSSLPMTSTVSDTGHHLETLNLNEAAEAGPTATIDASAMPMANRAIQSQDDLPVLAISPPFNPIPATEMMTTSSLDPNMNQANTAVLMDQSMVKAMSNPAMYSPSMGDGGDGRIPGPMRHSNHRRSSRSVSPYPSSTRSVTPDSDVGKEDVTVSDAATRMAQWRFPMTDTSVPASQALHPMDAYGRAVNGMDSAWHNSLRPPQTHRHGRRHNRAAVSEDFQGRHRTEAVYPSASSVDLTYTHPFPGFSPLPVMQETPFMTIAPQAMTPQRLVPISPNPQPVTPVMNYQSNGPTDVQSHAVPSLSFSMTSAGEQTPTDTSGELDSPPSPTRQPVSHARGKSDKSEDNVYQTAAQTHTPVVTTSAAQAASASRRKAEALFTCPFPDCGSTFTRQYNLRGHMRSHMDERPFKCDWPGCGRSFARTHDCKRHHNLHLNIKPYQCEGCGKTFARLDALNRHHKSEASTCGAKAANAKKNTPS
ncbi:RNA polymerase II regulator [Malassezia pachydermatis]